MIKLQTHWTFHRICLALAIGLTFTTAYFSEGYFGYDEQVQILEVIDARIAGADPKTVCWDYDARIRTALQPLIGEGIIRVSIFSGITNPHTQAFILRLLTGLLTLFASFRLINTFLPQINEGYKKLLIFLSYFFWVIPLMNVRFASETLSSALFIIGFSWLYNKKPKWILSGLLFGLACIFRYHLLAFVGGVSCWLLFVQKTTFQNIFKLLTGIFVVFILGIFIDSWFYDEFTFVLWRYFKVNLIDQVAANFGVLPWYFYLVWTSTQLTPIIGLLVISSSFLFFFVQFKHVITWMTIPFLVVHFLIGHKELRYILPMIYWLPFIVVYIYQYLNLKWIKSRYILLPLLVCSIVINLISLVVISTSPSGDGSVKIDSYLHTKSSKAEIIYYKKAKLLKLFPFYQDSNWKYSVVRNVNHINDSSIFKDQYIVVHPAELNELENLLNLKLEYKRFPDWLTFLHQFQYVDNRIFNFGVYRIVNDKGTN